MSTASCPGAVRKTLLSVVGCVWRCQYVHGVAACWWLHHKHFVERFSKRFFESILQLFLFLSAQPNAQTTHLIDRTG